MTAPKYPTRDLPKLRRSPTARSPLIVVQVSDHYNMAVDVVENHYPCLFPESLGDVEERRHSSSLYYMKQKSESSDNVNYAIYVGFM